MSKLTLWMDHSDDSFMVKYGLERMGIDFDVVFACATEENELILPTIESQFLHIEGVENIIRYILGNESV